MGFPLVDLLEGLSTRTAEKFERQPEVVDKDGSFDVSKLPVDKASWHRLSDVVAVYFDLKSSTNLERGRTPASTASIYDAGVGGVVRVLRELSADFVDIQGDGGFALFWGALRYERAVCAAVTVRTFSEDFTSQLEKKWTDAPSTGFKVGIASGPILAKRVGLPRQVDFQEPVWAGRAVNYAAKAAQQSDPERVIVTGSVWDAIQDNEYLAFSCGCVNGEVGASAPKALWEPLDLEKIPDDERYGQTLAAGWCETHGEEFITHVLRGAKTRAEVSNSARSDRNLRSLGSERRVQASKARETFRVMAKQAQAELKRE